MTSEHSKTLQVKLICEVLSVGGARILSDHRGGLLQSDDSLLDGILVND